MKTSKDFKQPIWCDHIEMYHNWGLQPDGSRKDATPFWGMKKSVMPSSVFRRGEVPSTWNMCPVCGAKRPEVI